MIPSANPSYTILKEKQCQRVSDGVMMPILSARTSAARQLVLVWSQLGDFDSLEYAWWLQREMTRLQAENLIIRAIGIGDRNSGQRFCKYTGFSPEWLFVDPKAELHCQLELYRGLSLTIPGFSTLQNSWLNLLLMCAGIGSPGTLAEVFRGYWGDRKAPQLFDNEEVVQTLPFLSIKGSLFKLSGGEGFQRPFELATLRLRNMIEVVSNWNSYVSDETYLTHRGGTFLFNGQGNLLYEHRSQGILGFAANMSRPLSFLNLGDK